MPCSVARRRRWRRRRRRLVALSFGSATAYMNTPHPHSLHSLSLSLSLSLSGSARARLFSSFSTGRIRRCPLCPSFDAAASVLVGRTRVRLYAPYARLRVRSRKFHTHVHCVYIPREQRREREAYTCTRTYCYVHAYNISASTGGIVCARACHRPVANERTWAWSWVRSGTCGERRVGAKGNGARVCVALAWDGRVCIYINT